MTTATLTAEATRDRVGLDTAYRLLWLAVIFDILAFGIGFGWDRQWHLTHPFEDFFSPPHLFIYSMHLCATLTLAYIAFTPDLRRWFGEAYRLPFFPVPVPGPIALAGGGFVITGLAGFFDSLWHNRFGLDETLWSFPHSMLGWGLLIAFLGITSCRLALARWKPIGFVSAAVFGFLIFSSSIERIPGPFMNNISPEILRWVATNIPVLAAEPAFQHTTRIYLAHDITRFNPLFMPLAAVGAGLAFGLLRRFDPRPLLVLVLGILLTRTTDFVPVIVPALVLSLRGSAAIGWRWWALAGFLFGVANMILPWHATLGGALIAGPLMALGAGLADRVWRVVESPTRSRVLSFVAVAGIVAPAVTGVIDLALRAGTP
jgi:hypothetical protein